MSISVQELKKICSRVRRNGHTQWIHISNMYIKWKSITDWEFEPGTPASLVRCSTTELYPSQLIPMVLLGQTTTFLPLQSFCPLRNTLHSVRTYWFSKCLINDGHSTKCYTKKSKYRNKHVWKILKLFF